MRMKELSAEEIEKLAEYSLSDVLMWENLLNIGLKRM
jgi:hypothetical protein